MARGNPNPETEHLKDYQFSTEGKHKKLSKKVISVRLPDDLDMFVRSLPNRNQWLIDAVLEKRKRTKKST